MQPATVYVFCPTNISESDRENNMSTCYPYSSVSRSFQTITDSSLVRMSILKYVNLSILCPTHTYTSYHQTTTEIDIILYKEQHKEKCGL